MRNQGLTTAANRNIITVMETQVPCKCRACGYEWEPRVSEPKQCPRCKRYDWQGPIARESAGKAEPKG